MNLKDKIFFRSDEQIILLILIAIFLLVSGIGITERENLKEVKFDNGITERENLKEVKIDKRIDINKADLFALEALPGIGPKLAEKIIDYRREQGNFKSIEEIIKVKGIGQKKFEKLSDLIIVKEGVSTQPENRSELPEGREQISQE